MGVPLQFDGSAVAAVVRRAFTVSRGARYSNAVAFVTAIEQALEADEAKRHRSTSSWGRLAGAAVLGAVVCAGVVVAWVPFEPYRGVASHTMGQYAWSLYHQGRGLTARKMAQEAVDIQSSPKAMGLLMMAESQAPTPVDLGCKVLVLDDVKPGVLCSEGPRGASSDPRFL